MICGKVATWCITCLVHCKSDEEKQSLCSNHKILYTSTIYYLPASENVCLGCRPVNDSATFGTATTKSGSYPSGHQVFGVLGCQLAAHSAAASLFALILSVQYDLNAQGMYRITWKIISTTTVYSIDQMKINHSWQKFKIQDPFPKTDLGLCGHCTWDEYYFIQVLK